MLSFRLKIATLSAIALTLPLSAFAQVQAGMDRAAGQAGFGSGSIAAAVGSIINALLGLAGVFLMGLVLFAGYTYMTAAEDTKKVETAKAMIKNAVIGLVIIVCSYVLASYVITQLGLAVR